jgi:hypothetical protein
MERSKIKIILSPLDYNTLIKHLSPHVLVLEQEADNPSTLRRIFSNLSLFTQFVTGYNVKDQVSTGQEPSRSYTSKDFSPREGPRPSSFNPQEGEAAESIAPKMTRIMKRASVTVLPSFSRIKREEVVRHSVDDVLHSIDGEKPLPALPPRGAREFKKRVLAHRASMSFIPALKRKGVKMSDDEIIDSSFVFYHQRDALKEVERLDSLPDSAFDGVEDDGLKEFQEFKIKGFDTR